MLRLEETDKRMLDGSMGPMKQKAMEFIVRYANVLGAEELCDVLRATLFIGAIEPSSILLSVSSSLSISHLPG